MSLYSPQVREHMQAFYNSLSEKDRRRYAAVEAEKLGDGGVEYIAALLGCDQAAGRVRKKGGTPAS